MTPDPRYYADDRWLVRAPDGLVAGVCAGLAERFGVDPSWVRLPFFVSIFFGGTGLVVYLILAWVLPRADQLPLEPTLWERAVDGRHHPPLRRTTRDRRLLGVMGGLARRWQMDPSILRLAAIGLATLSFGMAAVAYLVAALWIPSDDGAAGRKTTLL